MLSLAAHAQESSAGNGRDGGRIRGKCAQRKPLGCGQHLSALEIKGRCAASPSKENIRIRALDRNLNRILHGYDYGIVRRSVDPIIGA